MNYEIAAFILDRLDEAERNALAVADELRRRRCHDLWYDVDSTDGPVRTRTAVRIYEPSRAMLDINAKRRIVQDILHDAEDDSSDRILRLLALPWADHEKYDRKEWAVR